VRAKITSPTNIWKRTTKRSTTVSAAIRRSTSHWGGRASTSMFRLVEPCKDGNLTAVVHHRAGDSLADVS
jgi:hypothetical protein